MSARRRRARVPALLSLLATCAAATADGTRDGALAGAGTATAGQPPAWFEDVAAAVGIEFRHVRAPTERLWLPEIMSGGAAWLDADGDGWLDLYLVQGGVIAEAPSEAAQAATATSAAGGSAGSAAAGTPGAPAAGTADAARPHNVLLRNVEGRRFEDVTAASGTGDTGYGNGATAADYDGDGDVDLYVTNLGPNVLYRNEGGGRFSDVTAAAGVGDSGWGTSAAFFDYDGDGDLDLFVTNYVNWAPERELECFTGGALRDYCHPRHYNAPAADVLYRNDGERFTDVTEAAGLLRAFGHGLGVTVADFDGDGHLDIYVANDGMPNQLWHNNGEGTFEDVALLSGTAVNMMGQAEAGMGVVAADADDDGDLDLFMSHLRGETNTLYVNEGEFFRDATPAAGLAAPSVPYTGFGLGFADFDHDGRQDLLVVNGRVGRSLPPIVEREPFAEPNLLFRGLGDGRYALVTPAGGMARPDVENGRAAAFADYDEDGDVDVAVVNNGGPAQLLRNVAADGHWLGVRVLEGPRDAPGALVVATEPGGRRHVRLASPAYSYQSSSDPRVHFGLGATAAIADVSVRWPDGRLESFGPRAVDRYHLLRRGEGRGAPADGADAASPAGRGADAPGPSVQRPTRRSP